MPDDFELVRRVRDGDDAAFGMLAERHARYLFGVAHTMAGNAADAEDLVQETFAAAMRGRFRGEASVRTWLVGILVRRAAMFRRSRGRRERIFAPQGIEEPPDETSGASSTEARLDLSTMLGCLSPEHRAVIVLRELEGLMYEEMAAALEIPRGTVESRLHRAREELRKRFRGCL